jgi:hypothetical protein
MGRGGRAGGSALSKAAVIAEISATA